MKDLFKSTQVSMFVINEKLLVLLFLFAPLVFTLSSCQKDIAEKNNQVTVANSDAASQVAAAVAAANNTYYLSPTGNDNNPGTISSPFFSLNKAWSVIVPGDLVYLRGGTYNLKLKPELLGKSGTAGNLIKIWAYPGEVPILTEGAGYNNNEYVGMFLTGDYLHFKGIKFTGFIQTPTSFLSSGVRASNVNNCIFEQLETYNNGCGFVLTDNSNNNVILNCDSHDNFDPYTGGGNADGFGIDYCRGGNNIVKGCRAWNNSDDGFDGFENLGHLTLDNCWAWHNGYEPGTNISSGNGDGIKLGSAGSGNGNNLIRTVKNCVSYNNKLQGFDINEANCLMELYNNIAYSNRTNGFIFDFNNNPQIFKNNISWDNDANNAATNTASIKQANSTGGKGGSETGWNNQITSADFVSLDGSQLTTTRQSDGSLPVITFLHLAAGSSEINSGTVVSGISYSGTLPDRGAFETGGVTTPPPANLPPVANAGANQSITLPINTLTLSGSGTDTDVSITSYSWAKQSGGAVTLNGATTATLNLSGLVAGTYIFRLTVTDDRGATGFDDVTVIVSAATLLPNQFPVSNAGVDKNITLPANSVLITGSGSDPDGTIASHAWSLQSGPNTPLLSGSNTTALSASNLVAGKYVFRFTVTDNLGLTAFDEINVIVNAATITASTQLINISKAMHFTGFAYYLVQNFGTPADVNSNTTRSVLRIFENGIELTPPHSLHTDIASIGKGRFSHWKEGRFVALYFSASDNSNPKTNGRTYTYSITPK
jgi:hypothetical protein